MNTFVTHTSLEPATPAAAQPLHPKYRPDIDGLRAIAVISVVLFHAFPSALRGGFIGVDMFFVISGFLISSIIVANLENNTFSFLDFYGRRIRRIFPVLLLVVAVCYVAGWTTLMAGEYKQLGLHMASAANFTANFQFLRESGYFDSAAETKPLMHLWSLAVEEQFYIFWPAVLWLSWKKRFNLLSITVLVALISFGLNLGQIRSNPSAAFYLPQTRFWEMLAGCTLAYLALHPKTILAPAKARLDAWLGILIYTVPPPADGRTLRDVQSLGGAVLVAAGLWLITKERAFPGWWALMPTLGTVMMIAAGSGAWFNRTVLSHRLLVWVGLISFPLYLWHWPLLSFAQIIERHLPSAATRAAAMLCAVLLAWLSYKLLEKPMRSGHGNRAKTLVLAALMVLVGLVGYHTYQREGLGFRMKQQQEFAEYFDNAVPAWKYFNRVGIPQKYHHECEFFDIDKFRAQQNTNVPRAAIAAHCYQRDANKPHAVMLWGDSHAEHLSYGIRQNVPSDWQVLQVASSGCPPNPDAAQPSDTDQCAQSNWFAMKTIGEAKPSVVVVAQNAQHSSARYADIVAKLKALGVQKVVLLGPTPHWTADLPNLMMTKFWLNTPRRTHIGIDPAFTASNAALQAQFKPTEGVVMVDLIGFLCNKEGCLTYLGKDKKTGIVSYDYGHFTPLASDYVGRELLAGIITGQAAPVRK